MTPTQGASNMSSNRLKLLLLSVMAVVAISAVAASTASAKRVWTVGPPECVKVAAGTGEFTEEKCKTKVKVKGELAGTFELKPKVLPVGTTKSLTVVKNTAATLVAGAEEISCEKVTIKSGNTIENVLVESKGPTGRDTGTIEFTKCKNVKKPTECTVTEPISVNSPTSLVENTASTKIYDMFRPEGRTELTPKQISEFPGTEAEKQAKAKTEEEKLSKYTTIKQTGTGCVTATEVTGDGVAAEISPESESVKKKLIFSCPTTLTPVKLWNGVEIGLKLKAFGVAAKECINEVEVELTTKEAWDVE
jgi:hypothetical protein